tara:strand:- start:4552 stop:5382 length:831 start_codon:yes stop_codon:yes gene_type:complete
MRIKHNKKRNTAFVYEALIVEATMAVLKKNEQRQKKVINIIKNYFNSRSILKKELDCYRSLYENQNLKSQVSKRIIEEARLQQNSIDPDTVFKTQTALIGDINKKLGSLVFDNFVPNYKTLATIAQMFSNKTSPKNQIILENQVMTSMSKPKSHGPRTPGDITLYNTFVGKFNEKYESGLLEEQKELLTYYISSFTDNAVSLKIFLNEEIGRLKTKLKEARSIDEISRDENMLKKTNMILEKLESFSRKPIADEVLLTILKTQALVREINTNGDIS